MQGSTNGVLLTMKSPNITAYVDKERLYLKDLNRLNVMLDLGSSQFHSDAGNSGLHA